jgi:hypothetical protein
VRQIVEAFDDIGSVERMADGGAGNRAADQTRARLLERFPDEIDAANRREPPVGCAAER